MNTKREKWITNTKERGSHSDSSLTVTPGHTPPLPRPFVAPTSLGATWLEAESGFQPAASPKGAPVLYQENKSCHDLGS